jgi:hypothetical protein
MLKASSLLNFALKLFLHGLTLSLYAPPAQVGIAVSGFHPNKHGHSDRDPVRALRREHAKVDNVITQNDDH